MSTSNPKVDRIVDTIRMLENVRDKILAGGGGPYISDDIFDTIDRLYGELLKALGQEPGDEQDK